MILNNGPQILQVCSSCQTRDDWGVAFVEHVDVLSGSFFLF